MAAIIHFWNFTSIKESQMQKIVVYSPLGAEGAVVRREICVLKELLSDYSLLKIVKPHFPVRDIE